MAVLFKVKISNIYNDSFFHLVILSLCYSRKALVAMVSLNTAFDIAGHNCK